MGDDGSSRDVLIGGAGDDAFYGLSNDTVVFNQGWGHDQISSWVHFSDSPSTLQFGDGIAAEDIRVSYTDYYGTLLLSNRMYDDTIGLWDFENIGISTLRFADGTEWDIATLKAQANLPSVYNDWLFGTVDDDVINALAGDDHIIGNSGSDLLQGGNGDDTLVEDYGIFSGDDTLDGGFGNDWLQGGGGSDTYLFSDDFGQDIVSDEKQASTTDTIRFTGLINASDIQVSRYPGEYLVLSQFGTDNWIKCYTMIDIVQFTDISLSYAELTAKALAVGTSDDDFNGSSADDKIDMMAGNDTVHGFAGNDTLYGGDGDDVVYGEEGNDFISGGAGSNQLVGGAGDDVYSVTSQSDNIIELLTEGLDEVQAWVSYELSENIENLTLVGTTGTDGTGNQLNNLLTGNIAANMLAGGLGDDTYVVDALDTVIEAAESGFDMIRSTVTWTLAANIEALVLLGDEAINGTGNTLNNTLTGNVAANRLAGGLGDDTYVVNTGDTTDEAFGAGSDTVRSNSAWSLSANIENLTLFGGAAVSGIGNDLNNIIKGNSAANQLLGGLGDDTYLVSTGDSVVEEPNSGIDTVQSNADWSLADNIENLTLTGSIAINGNGNALNNVITGNGNANSLTGGDGDDRLDGRAGVDSMAGGLGNDNYVVTSGDAVIEQVGEGIDTVESAATYTLSLNVENLVLTGAAAVKAVGNEGKNMIMGNAAANILVGKEGSDTLLGGLGADRFTYTGSLDTGVSASSRDIIQDFSSLDGDKIDLKSLDANPTLTGIQRWTFVTNFNSVSGQVSFNSSSHLLVLDRNGDNIPELQIELLGVMSLTSSDLILV
ncbi:calcium-binding protein [Methylocucumis oryzae]|uniref:Peptidase M10 serralysin C-terminal domain-containing protein n=1 Tax=Methylocucumis oryzae TaxID=1632867 RepID=A0A0F3ILQ4_9GAMM|nr:calcium-binding protein [Methylocucumis oryzae]KJV07463.1 hypothetical protein VZ94_04625 [Methylocucumis oryzae]